MHCKKTNKYNKLDWLITYDTWVRFVMSFRESTTTDAGMDVSLVHIGADMQLLLEANQSTVVVTDSF